MSFEITSNEEKIICNLGFDINKSSKIKLLSKTTAAHSTLYLNNRSSCIFNNIYPTKIYGENKLSEGLKVMKKKLKVKKILRILLQTIMDTKVDMVIFMKDL